MQAGECETLAGFLQFQRDTLAWKCSGLSDEQLRRRAVDPSELSLLGLVRHMTDVERVWFQRVLGGEDVPFLYWRRENGEQNIDFAVDDADVESSLQAWLEECAASRTRLEVAESLDVTGLHRATGLVVSLRWILTHMIEEYARHLGHADLLRERIDGLTGV